MIKRIFGSGKCSKQTNVQKPIRKVTLSNKNTIQQQQQQQQPEKMNQRKQRQVPQGQGQVKVDEIMEQELEVGVVEGGGGEDQRQLKIKEFLQALTDHYEKEYSHDLEISMSHKQLDYSNALSKTDIKVTLRAKMVDWMIEVFGNYPNTTSHNTFFLAIHIMDLFFKHFKGRRLRDSDVHLTGVSSMLIATKYDDIYQITLKDFVEKVGHNKFTADEIKEREWEILNALNYNVTFPTTFQFFEKIMYKNFQQDSTQGSEEIRMSSIYLLKMVYMDSNFLNIQPYLIATSVLCYAIKTYFYGILSEISHNNRRYQEIATQENILLQSIVDNSNLSTNCIEECMKEIRSFVNQFSEKYPDLNNLEKFKDCWN